MMAYVYLNLKNLNVYLTAGLHELQVNGKEKRDVVEQKSRVFDKYSQMTSEVKYQNDIFLKYWNVLNIFILMSFLEGIKDMKSDFLFSVNLDRFDR